MNDVVSSRLPVVIAAVVAIVLLHIASALISTLVSGRTARVIIAVLSALNGIAHIGLFAYSLVKDIPKEELLLMFMISAAVGTVSIGISEKRKKAREGK